jgi:hypothetical protein
MANECVIENANKTRPSDLLGFLKVELEKIGLIANGRAYPNELVMECHGMFFPISFKEDKIVLFDVPESALFRHDQKHNEYLELAFKNGSLYCGYTTAYAYVHEYIKNKIARGQNSILVSDGIGSYSSFNSADRLASFSSWMKYYEASQHLDSVMVKLLRAIRVIPSFQTVEKRERKFFPTLK